MSEKRTLPLLPLRGLVVYPHMMVNLDVGRDRSVAAIERAIAGDSCILVVSQKEPETDDPTAADLYNVGTVAEIRQFLRMPEGVLRILVDGQKRAEILVREIRMPKQMFTRSRSRRIQPRRRILRLLSTGSRANSKSG